MQGIEFAVQKLQGGWKDIHSFGLKTSDSVLLPVYSKFRNEQLAFVVNKSKGKGGEEDSKGSKTKGKGKGKGPAKEELSEEVEEEKAEPVAKKPRVDHRFLKIRSDSRRMKENLRRLGRTWSILPKKKSHR